MSDQGESEGQYQMYLIKLHDGYGEIFHTCIHPAFDKDEITYEITPYEEPQPDTIQSTVSNNKFVKLINAEVFVFDKYRQCATNQNVKPMDIINSHFSDKTINFKIFDSDFTLNDLIVIEANAALAEANLPSIPSDMLQNIKKFIEIVYNQTPAEWKNEISEYCKAILQQKSVGSKPTPKERQIQFCLTKMIKKAKNNTLDFGALEYFYPLFMTINAESMTPYLSQILSHITAEQQFDAFFKIVIHSYTHDPRETYKIIEAFKQATKNTQFASVFD